MPSDLAASSRPPASAGRREDALEALRRYWGFEGFREGQWEAIAGVLDGRDGLAVLPTGGGKSLLYQLPAVLREKS